ncbi:TPA: hypothetical protein ACF632_000504 [Salmonella enterica]
MANYFIRVELHDADEPFAYEELHKKMEARGYQRHTQSSQNPGSRGLGLREAALILKRQNVKPFPVVQYQLPTAVYIRESDLPIDDIVQDVKNIASDVKSVKTNPMVVVVNYSEISFCNLPKV